VHDSDEHKTPARWAQAKAQAALPDRLGRYVIIERIGAGMMGVVYAAYDPTLDRKVAVKILHGQKTGGAAAEARRRLVREARSMARLSDPHVVPIYDAGIVEGPKGSEVFLAMEFVDGMDLEAWLEDLAEQTPASHLRNHRVLQAFLQAGRGLAAAHDAHLVHRDFKPSNVLVTRGGRVKVTDFGLARSPSDSEPAPQASTRPVIEPALTATGEMLGTPAYMAPEQHQGESVGAASDQFAFCVALYEALYGKPPFAGKTYAQRAVSVVEGHYVEPPSEARVPPAVATALRRGLRRDPKERHESMHDLVQALEAAVHVKSTRSNLAVAAVLVLLLVAVAAFATMRDGPCAQAGRDLDAVWNDDLRAQILKAWTGTGLAYAPAVHQQLRLKLDDYAARWKQATVRACEATKVERVQSRELLDRRTTCLDTRRLEFVAFVLELTEPDAALVQGALAASEGLPDLQDCANLSRLSAQQAAANSKQSPAIQTLRAALAKARGQARAGRYALSLKTVQTASAAWGRRRFAPVESELLLAQGTAMAALAQPLAAESALSRAFMLAQKARHQPVAAQASAALVPVVGVHLARHKEGLLWVQIAQATLQQYGPQPAARAGLEGLRARVLSAQGERKAAMRSARRALQQLRSSPEATPYELARAQLQLGQTLVDIRDYRAALPVLQDAVRGLERSLGPEHPELIAPLTWLGRAQQGEILMADAQESLQRAISLAEAHLGRDHALRGEALMRRATMHTRLNEHALAIPDYREALRILSAAYGAEHTLVARAWLNLGVTYHRMGDLKQAALHYNQALALREARLGREHPDLAVILQNLGSMAVESGRSKQAIEPLSRAMTIRTKHLASPVAVADVQYWLGRALYDSARDRRRGLGLVRRAHQTFVRQNVPPQENTRQWLKARGLSESGPAEAGP